MINKINRLNFSVISSKLSENNINNNNTEIPVINNKSNLSSKNGRFIEGNIKIVI